MFMFIITRLYQQQQQLLRDAISTNCTSSLALTQHMDDTQQYHVKCRFWFNSSTSPL